MKFSKIKRRLVDVVIIPNIGLFTFLIWMIYVNIKHKSYMDNDTISLAIIIIAIIVLFNLIVYCGRRIIFRIIYINDEGVKLIYRKKIIKKVDWFEIKYIILLRNAIYFYKNENELIPHNTKDEFCFNLSIKKAKCVKYYLDKYQIQVTYIYKGACDKRIKKIFNIE